MTDTSNNVFPASEDWDLFELDHNWGTKNHLEACHRLLMTKGKFPPVNGYTIPTPFDCVERLSKEEKKGKKEQTTGTSSAASTSQPIFKIADQMEESNTLLRIKMGLVPQGPAAELTKVQRVKRGMDELYQERKVALDSGYPLDSANIKDIDERLTKYGKRYAELKAFEDEDLFA